mgnify:CR=1 FL=1
MEWFTEYDVFTDRYAVMSDDGMWEFLAPDEESAQWLEDRLRMDDVEPRPKPGINPNLLILLGVINFILLTGMSILWVILR